MLRSPRSIRPPRAATRPQPRPRYPVPAVHKNRPSAPPAPAGKENQCTESLSSLTVWESLRFKSGENCFRQSQVSPCRTTLASSTRRSRIMTTVVDQFDDTPSPADPRQFVHLANNLFELLQTA